MKEIWKDIKGYEGHYQVSNIGRVKSLDRIIYTKYYYRGRKQKGEILKLQKDKDGYVVCPLKKEGKSYILKVHRMVAKAFIDNPNNYSCVDHINGIRDDNRVENLRWCTNKQNANFELAKVNRRNAALNILGNNALRKLRAETFRKAKIKRVELFIMVVHLEYLRAKLAQLNIWEFRNR